MAEWKSVNDWENIPVSKKDEAWEKEYTSISYQPPNKPPTIATAAGDFDDFDNLKKRVAALGTKEALELFKFLKHVLGI